MPLILYLTIICIAHPSVNYLLVPFYVLLLCCAAADDVVAMNSKSAIFFCNSPPPPPRFDDGASTLPLWALLSSFFLSFLPWDFFDDDDDDSRESREGESREEEEGLLLRFPSLSLFFGISTLTLSMHHVRTSSPLEKCRQCLARCRAIEEDGKSSPSLGPLVCNSSPCGLEDMLLPSFSPAWCSWTIFHTWPKCILIILING